ncbi:MAG: GMC family oxidoreductase [Thermoleophilaceae bacterium]
MTGESELSDIQRSALEALCDTIVPRIERPDDSTGFWARTASDLGVDRGVESLICGIPDAAVRGGLFEVLQVLYQQGIAKAPSQRSREQVVRNLSLFSAQSAAGVGALVSMILFLTYGAPDPETGRNPNWETFGYAGPLSAPPDVPKPIEPLTPQDGAVLEADVCVVGSGAGGGVIAGTLAQQGMKVIVLEAGGYYNESDFTQLELKAYQEMYWHGGPTPTGDGNVSLQAGATLGGGTTVNWTNCLRTHPWVREQWAREHGLEGVDGPEYDRHLDTVLERIGANDSVSDLNGPQQRLKEGCEKLGWDFRTVVRNADPDRYDPVSAGYLGFGDQSGSKQSTVKTFLQDAHEHDADIIVRCHADRILVENRQAVGVAATYHEPQGGTRKLTIRAPTVVVAGGALESPALLLRSQIGGPAAGHYLRLHPCAAVFASYSHEQEAWWGAPQAGLSEEFADTGDGYGFMIETVQYTPGITGSAVPWTSGEAHKEMMERVRYGANFISLTRDRGHGQVMIDSDGESMAFYSVTDELDLKNLRHGIETQVRLHAAAGAQEIFSLAAGLPHWRVGDKLELYVERVKKAQMGAGGQRLFSAHQMGSCRMGTDPARSVAGPWGELHDVRGVWIGDGSAFPTASGTNPMVSIMALAHRTAEAILESGDRAGSSARATSAARS